MSLAETCLFRILIVVLFVVGVPTIGKAQLTRADVGRAKQATALVERPSGDGFGSCFCITRNGLFITNEHVISGESEKIPLIINPGTADEKKLLSTIVRKDARRDLALLKLDNPPADLEVLELGDDSELFETQQVTVFGYPFGTALALRNQKYPSISVNVGRIASLRQSRGQLKTIQIDAVVNPGNSGGPMLSADAKVIGVIVEKVTGTDVNFAIPVSDLKEFLSKPQLVLSEATIRFATRQELTKLKFEVMEFGIEPEEYRMELTLGNGVDRSQQLELEQEADGFFVAEIYPVQKKGAPLMFPVTVELSSGTITGTMAEQRVEADGAALYLAEISSLVKSGEGEWTAIRFDGEEVSVGDIRFDAPDIWLGETKLPLDLDAVKELKIGVPEDNFAKYLAYEAKIYRSDRLVDSARGKISLIGAPGESSPSTSASGESAIAMSNDDKAEKEEEEEEPEGPTEVARGTPYLLPDGKVEFKDELLVYQFDESFSEYVMAGAERYAAFKFDESRKIEVFDLLKGDVVHTIEDVDTDALMCGGSEHFFIALPSQMLLQRYSLGDFKREKVSRLPLQYPPEQIHIGVNADDFLFVYDTRELHIVDVDRLKPIQIGDEPLFKSHHTAGKRRFDISADGRIVSSIRLGVGPVHHEALFIGDKAIYAQKLTATSNAHRWARPTPRGRLFLMRRGEICNEWGKSILPKWLETTQLFPTVDPRYFISVNVVGDGNRKFTNIVSICTASDYRVIHSLNEFHELEPHDKKNVGYDALWHFQGGNKKVHYIPWANLFFDTDYYNKNVYLRKYDLEEELKSTGEDYLFVDSLPPFAAFKNETLEYQIVTKSNAETVSYELLEGPKGMRVSAGGLLTWRPSRGEAEEIVPVVVNIKSANGDENLHTFQLAVLASTEKRR